MPCEPCQQPPALPESQYNPCPCKLRDGVYEHARIVVQNGCIIEIASGEPFVYVPEPCCGQGGGSSSQNVIHSDTASVRLSGNGTTNTPLKGDIKLSATANNAMRANADGLYVQGAIPQAMSISVAHSNSVSLSGDGSPNAPVTANAKVSPTVGNIIQSTDTGLYAPPAVPRLQVGNGQLMSVDDNNRLLTRVNVTTETTQAIRFEGDGTPSRPLKAEVQIAPDLLNSLQVIDGKLFVRQETTRAEYFSGSAGSGVIVWDIVSGYCIAMGTAPAVATASGGPAQPTCYVGQVTTAVDSVTQTHTHTVPAQTISVNTLIPTFTIVYPQSFGIAPDITWSAAQLSCASGAHMLITNSHVEYGGFVAQGFCITTRPTTVGLNFVAWGRRNDHA